MLSSSLFMGKEKIAQSRNERIEKEGTITLLRYAEFPKVNESVGIFKSGKERLWEKSKTVGTLRGAAENLGD